MSEHIHNDKITFLIVGLFVLIAAIITFYWSKKWGIRLLILSSGILAFFTAYLDPFLNLWDEQQHALVAKNMAKQPFKPMLYVEPLLPYHHEIWIQNHIWVHKQPLFLWQIALSIKLFGANVLAVRLPSILMHALLPYIIYRIATIVRDERTGLIAGIFIALANFPLELVGGRFATDHNDMAFLFYVSWSLLCWFEYQKSGDRKWLIWLGVSTGGAVLIKWLMGLLVYLGWFMVITVTNKFQLWKIKDYFIMIKPFLISLLVFVPWQVYCFIRFPIEAAHEFKASASHFSKALEGHTGPWNYHVDTAFGELYFPGDLMPFIVLLLVGMGIWQLKSKQHRIFFSFSILFVYIFFSIAITKMLGFTLIAMPLVLIASSMAIIWLVELPSKWMKKKWVPYFLLVSTTIYPAYTLFNWKKLQIKHSEVAFWDNADRANEIKELELINALKDKYGDEKIVIFNGNVTPVGSVQIMFFTDYIAYPQIPNEKEIEIVLENDFKVVLIDRGDLPSEFNDDRIDIFPYQN